MLTTPISDDVEEEWTALSHSITSCATQILGTTKAGRKRGSKESWFWNDAVQNAVKIKSVACKRWKASRLAEDRASYLQSKHAAKVTVANAKANFYEQVYNDLDTPAGEKQIYRIAKARSVDSHDISHMKNIKCERGKVLSSPPEICERWRRHFETISSEEFAHPPIPSGLPIYGPVQIIAETEVIAAIAKMQPNKACGPEDVSSVAWKLSGPAGISRLTELLNKAVAQNNLPADWHMSTTVPIWKKKGDVLDCNNYRPIRLMPQSVKILERIIDTRIRNLVNLSICQCGFQKGVGTSDAIFAMRQLIEKHRSINQTIHSAFLDLEKAFDRVPHDVIWYALRDHLIPEQLVCWIKLMYTRPTSVVRCAAGISLPYRISVGVHQGSALSPLLFILVMDTVCRDLMKPPPWTLIYADDVVLNDTNHISLELQTRAWKERFKLFGLRLNVAKTIHLESGVQTDARLSIDNQDLHKPLSFKYLGSNISSDGSPYADASARSAAAWLKWKDLTGVLCDRRMPIRLKAKVYKTMVRPVAIYGAECRPSTKKTDQLLHTMEMRMLRWSLGITRLDHVTNVEVRNRLGIRPITEKVTERRLRWYGHILRQNNNAVARASMDITVDGCRSRGRPKLRWIDNINRDMLETGLTVEDASNRPKWRTLSSKADPVFIRD